MKQFRAVFLQASLTAILLLAASPGATAQTSSQRAAVQLSATVQAAPAQITLSWAAMASTTSITIYRKTADATSWGSAIATPAASSLSYQDNTVAVGTLYEYRVVRVAGGVTGNGYISSGIAVPPVDYRGRMILLVDNTFSSPLASELATLEKDLRMDGWAVVRTNLARTASVATVKSTILGHYNADPQNTKAVFIVGHLAVPYSGNQAPDGHSEHSGAWPCDGYYGEINGTWTDNSVNNSGPQRAENRNIPGDGKFDQSNFPSPLELQVGRVDFHDMPAFSQSETELLRAYLNKLHAYKVKQWTPQQRALVYDNLQWVSNPLAASAWRSFPPLVGTAQTTAANHNMYEYPQLLHNQSYLWTYFSGGGVQATTGGVLTYNGAARCGTTESWASSVTTGGVFNLSFGSYFGDWDNRNNFLRAPLASGQALTNVWAAIPAWYFHHMGMGANIGYSTLMTMNNSALYTPLTDGWQGSIGRAHLALMGDPSLRQRMLLPPANLSVSNAGGFASFSWSPSTETVDGYHLYSIEASTGAVTRITNAPVTGTTHTSATVPFVAGREYMVRAVRLITEPSGSYYNLSLGVSAIAAGSTGPDCNGVVGGPSVPGTPCNDGNACTTNDTWNANCQCTGLPTGPTASITAGGPTSFCTGGTVTLSANTGSGLTYQWRRNGTNLTGATSSTYTATTAGTYTVVVSSGGCATTSAGVTVTVATPPAATISAGGPTTFCTGGSVVLSANTGTGFTYQWRRDGTWITGANSSTYTVTTSGFYSVIVYSNGCNTYSSILQVSVTGPPAATITAGGATSFCSGGSVVLSANAGTGLTYQWRRNGTSISGATAASYTATTAGSYTVVVSSGGCSTTSAATTVAIGTAPAASITAGGPTSFCTGGSVALSANTGTGLTYQWRRDGATISGATASTYTATQSGTYSVVVTSSGCSNASSGIAVSASGGVSATITAAGSTSFCSGGSVVLNAGTGTGYTYQWRRNGTAISGATAASYTANLAGSYTVVVTSGSCSATSNATTVTVSTAPTATITNGSSASFCTGSSVTLNAATGTGYTYQWRRSGANISGATAATYAATTAGNYTVTVTNGGCAATSGTTVVSTIAAPVITCSSSPASGTVSVSVTSGTGPYTYAWSTTPMQTTATATVQSSGTYTVTVRGANGCESTCSVSMTLAGAGCTEPRTVTQGVWGSAANATNLSGYMTSNWAAAFPAPNYLTLGCGSRLLRFTTANAVITTLPTTGTAALLPVGTTIDPGTSISNTLLGHLAALKITVRMDEINPAFGPSGTQLKNMVISAGTFGGWTVQQLINHADQAIGGCVAQYPLITIASALANINNGYSVAGQGNGYLTCPGGTGMAFEPTGTNAGVGGGFDLGITLFPNPTRGETTVLIPTVEWEEGYTVDLYALSGAWMGSIAQGRTEAGVPTRIGWDAARWPAGAYVCRVIIGDAVLHARVIIE
ncbi:MAG: hypothetical protein QY325_14160 [Flavobacteriales bacterium]|nr:MAG: hypothetical protein QY325_14160 [Flavobacteriales bacterium]